MVLQIIHLPRGDRTSYPLHPSQRSTFTWNLFVCGSYIFIHSLSECGLNPIPSKPKSDIFIYIIRPVSLCDSTCLLIYCLSGDRTQFPESTVSTWNLGGQVSLVDKALDYRPKGTGFDPRLNHKKGAQHKRLIVSPCEIKIC
jgi:hypothetical protein